MNKESYQSNNHINPVQDNFIFHLFLLEKRGIFAKIKNRE